MLNDLLSKIIDIFPSYDNYIIELAVLTSESGYLDIYKGSLGLLNSEHLEKEINKSGCFYSIQVIGILEDRINENSIKNTLSYNDIIRREFCWMTDPTVPIVKCVDPHTLEINWNRIEYIGFKPTNNNVNIRYSIELAEGPNYSNNFHSKFIAENLKKIENSLDFIDLYNTSTYNHVVISDLKPAKWYVIRLVIQYLGIIRSSERVIVNTICTVPSPPSLPRLYCSLVSKYDTNQVDKPSLMLGWSPSENNGSEVIKYQVQLQEIDINGNIIFNYIDKPIKESTSLPILNTNNSPKVKSRHNNKKNQTSSSIIKYTTHTSRWKTIYTNQTNKCYLPLPSNNISEWLFRVRTCNEFGWSDFSESLVVNGRQFPTLFAHPNVNKNNDNVFSENSSLTTT